MSTFRKFYYVALLICSTRTGRAGRGIVNLGQSLNKALKEVVLHIFAFSPSLWL